MPDLIDFDQLGEYERYKLMAALIVPRPIAWVTTRSADGVTNAAPFSMFAMVGEDPPMLMVSINRLAHGGSKDTAANIDATGEFVIHIPDAALMDSMDATAQGCAPEVNELDLVGLTTRTADLVSVPIIDSAPVALECTLDQRIEIPSRHIYFGIIRRLHAADGLVDQSNWHVSLTDYHPIGRFGASFYTTTRERLVASGQPLRTAIDSL